MLPELSTVDVAVTWEESNRSFPGRSHGRGVGGNSTGVFFGKGRTVVSLEYTQEGDLLEAILDRDNLNRAYKRVKRNHGAPGIDGMTVEEALPWLREHKEELLQSIREGKYRPNPVRRNGNPNGDRPDNVLLRAVDLKKSFLLRIGFT